MSARDFNTSADWYGDMQNDAAFLGDLEVEQRRFDHERPRDLPTSMGAWMREQLEHPTPEQIAKRKRLADLFDSFETKWAVEKQHRATSPVAGSDSPVATDATSRESSGVFLIGSETCG